MDLKQCRYCKIRDIDPQNIDSYIMPSKGWYYHKNCYEKKGNEKKIKVEMRQCIYCKQKFDISKEDYVMPRPHKYAHKECYQKNYTPDEEYIVKIYSLLKEEIGMTYDYPTCERQRINFITKLGYTNEGIYNALKYHYLVKKGSVEKSGNRIGIVSYVYNEAQEYYQNLKTRQEKTTKELQSQLQQNKKIIKIKSTFDKDRRKYIDLDLIEDEVES